MDPLRVLMVSVSILMAGTIVTVQEQDMRVRGLNKIWWLWLVPTSTTRFAIDVGYRMAKKLIGLCKEMISINNDISLV